MNRVVSIGCVWVLTERCLFSNGPRYHLNECTMPNNAPSKRVSYLSNKTICLLCIALPVLITACNIGPGAKEAFVAAEGATVIDDLQLAFMLPEGWWQNGDPVRATAPKLEDQLTPEQIEALEKSDPDALSQEEDLQAALYMYMYHNLPTSQDSVSVKPAEDIFYHALLLNVHTYYDKDILSRWERGECTRAQDMDCLEGGDPNGLALIRPLESHENPFSSGKGYLYQVLEAQIPVLSYIYYFVRNGWAYQVTYEITENERSDWQYPPVLDTIEFMK